MNTTSTCRCAVCKYQIASQLPPIHTNQQQTQKSQVDFLQNNYIYTRRNAICSHDDDDNNNDHHQISTLQQFEEAAKYINDNNIDPSSLFLSLTFAAKNLLKKDKKYQILYTNNPKVMQRFIGWKGVIPFLNLLGFQSDEYGNKLICKHKPSKYDIANAVDVLSNYIKIPELEKETNKLIKYGGTTTAG
eukprot:284936_1